MQAVFRGLVTAKPLFCCSEGGVLRIGGVGGPPRTGPGCLPGPVARRGERLVSLHRNPPPEVGGDLPPCPRRDCCRFHALRGIGLLYRVEALKVVNW